MTSEEKKTIDELIRQNYSFAIYRIPGEEKAHFCMQTTGEPEIIQDIKALNDRKGFIIAPFRINKAHPILIIKKEKEQIPSWQEIKKKKEQNTTAYCKKKEDRKEYSILFNYFIDALQKQEYEKLVLSRYSCIPKNKTFSSAEAFTVACQRYPYSYVYLYHTPLSGTWLGSTPEILLSGEKEQWHTVALAGTQLLQENKIPEIWSEKDQEEQAMVSSYILNQLKNIQIEPTTQGPYPVRAGKLSHLKTDFHFALPKGFHAGSLLNLLHPTPAVCGLPKEKALSFILENENYDREYYSGFLGWLDQESRSDLYVNLRCMKIEENKLTLYAGSGLLASSKLEEEWQEIENKLQTMQALING